MPTININFDVTLDDYEIELLEEILGISANSDSIEEVLSQYAKSSLEEYIRMFMGQKVFTRGSDFKEYRLFLIIKKALNENMPDEETISRLFQLTSSESRSLLRSVMSKYQYDLNPAIDRSIKTTLMRIDQSEDPHTFTSTGNIVNYLNRVLTSLDGSLQPIKHKSNTVAVFEIRPASYEALAEKYQIHVEQEA